MEISLGADAPRSERLENARALPSRRSGLFLPRAKSRGLHRWLLLARLPEMPSAIAAEQPGILDQQIAVEYDPSAPRHPRASPRGFHGRSALGARVALATVAWEAFEPAVPRLVFHTAPVAWAAWKPLCWASVLQEPSCSRAARILYRPSLYVSHAIASSTNWLGWTSRRLAPSSSRLARTRSSTAKADRDRLSVIFIFSAGRFAGLCMRISPVLM